MITADDRIVAYQLAVARKRNGDPHVIVGNGEPLTELRKAIDDGRVDEAIVAQNRALNWHNYDEEIEGTFSSGEPPIAEPVKVDRAVEFLRWSIEDDATILAALLDAFGPLHAAWRLDPTFLTADFFDSEGCNYAWLLATADRWYAILTSFYPCPRPFP